MYSVYLYEFVYACAITFHANTLLSCLPQLPNSCIALSVLCGSLSLRSIAYAKAHLTLITTCRLPPLRVQLFCTPSADCSNNRIYTICYYFRFVSIVVVVADVVAVLLGHVMAKRKMQFSIGSCLVRITTLHACMYRYKVELLAEL